MREVFGRMDEDGVVSDQEEEGWQWRADFLSGVLALLGLPLPELLEHEDTPDDVTDSPALDGDVLGGDDGLLEVSVSSAELIARRRAGHRAKRALFQGTRVRRSRAAAADRMREARDELARRTEERCTKRKANHFAWVMLIAGSSYHTLMMVLSFLGFWVPPQSTVYTAQKGMIEILHRLALASCARWRGAMRQSAVIGFDAAWSHTRRALHCFGCFCTTGHRDGGDWPEAARKIVGFGIVDQSGGSGVEVASQAMEGVIFRELVQSFRGQSSVCGIVTDRDGQVGPILREEGWQIVELLDRNHVVKGYNRLWEETVMMPASETSAKRSRIIPLELIATRLKRWFYVVIKMEGDQESRHRAWMGALDHFLAPDVDWAGRDDPVAVERLRGFIQRTERLLDDCQGAFSTQLNESVNAIKNHLACKAIAWKNSWAARVYVAVLNQNEGREWQLPAYEELVRLLHFPALPSRCKFLLAKDAEVRGRRAAEQRTDECRGKANLRRIIARRASGAQTRRAAKKGLPMHGGGKDDVAVADVSDLVAVLEIPDGGPYEKFYGFGNSAGKWCHLNANLVVLFGAASLTRLIAENADAGPVCHALIDMLLLAKDRRAPVPSQALRKALAGYVEGGLAYWGEWRDPCDTSVALITALRTECPVFAGLFCLEYETVPGGQVQSRAWVGAESSRLLRFLANLDREVAPNGKVRSWPGLLIVHLAPPRAVEGTAPACDVVQVPMVLQVGSGPQYHLLSFVRQLQGHATARLVMPSGRWWLYDDDRLPRVTGAEELNVSDRFRVLLFEKICV
jgi:hypothetical protein